MHAQNRKVQPGSETQQKAEPNSWTEHPAAYTAWILQSHGTVEEGQILPARKSILNSQPLLGPVPLPSNSTNHPISTIHRFSGHMLLLLQHPAGHTIGHLWTTARREQQPGNGRPLPAAVAVGPALPAVPATLDSTQKNRLVPLDQKESSTSSGITSLWSPLVIIPSLPFFPTLAPVSSLLPEGTFHPSCCPSGNDHTRQ